MYGFLVVHGDRNVVVPIEQEHLVIIPHSSGGSRKLVRGWRFVEGAAITIKKRFSKRIRGARTLLFSFLPRKN
jgi:hypothetical protein